MSATKPVHEIRLGRIRASVWQNAGAGPPFSVTFSRLYKDEGAGKWASSDSFSRDELLLLAKVADLAHTFVCEQAGKTAEMDESPVA